MGTFQTIEDARAYFAEDRFATENGMWIERLTDDECVCALKLTERHKNALGGVMGGAIFTLADFAFAVASNHARKGTVSLESSIHYLSGVKGELLFAKAVCVKRGRSVCVYEVSVTDDIGTEAARFVGTGWTL